MFSNLYKWYVVYTNPRAEKKVFNLFKQNAIEAYLPLQKQLKQWSDRKKWVEEPLFRSYVFVYVSEKEYVSVLNIPGVVRYITFSGKAVSVREEQINLIKRLLATESELELTNHTFKKGEQVKISAGPLTGLQGELVSFQSQKKFLIRVENLDQALLLNIAPVYLEPL